MLVAFKETVRAGGYDSVACSQCLPSPVEQRKDRSRFYGNLCKG